MTSESVDVSNIDRIEVEDGTSSDTEFDFDEWVKNVKVPTLQQRYNDLIECLSQKTALYFDEKKEHKKTQQECLKLYRKIERLKSYKKYVESKPRRIERYKLWQTKKERKERNRKEVMNRMGATTKEEYKEGLKDIKRAKEVMIKRRGEKEISQHN